MSIAAKTRKNTASVTRQPKFLSGNRESLKKNLDETVHLQSEKREEWVREIRERLQGIAEKTSSTTGLANSSVASFPGRNEFPGTHYSLMVQGKEKAVPARSAREIEVKGKTERKGQSESRTEGKEKWQIC